MLEEFMFSLFEVWEGIMKLVKQVNHYVDREEKNMRKQSNITGFFKITN